jgi:hypothetical protein
MPGGRRHDRSRRTRRRPVEFHGLLRKVIDLGLLLVSVTPTSGIQTSTAADLPHPVDDDL